MTETPNIDEWLAHVEMASRGAGNRDLRSEIFLAREGERHVPRPLPTDVPPGEPKACFHNAQMLAMNRPDLLYAEGFAHSIITTEHAWCVDIEGNVVDPTWPNPEAVEYLGVAFRSDFVARRLLEREKSGPLLNDRQSDFEIVRGRLSESEWRIKTGFVAAPFP